MRVTVGANWQIRHLTDRVVELVKDDVAYRKMTGRDGFVRVRVEPEETRSHALDRAVALAEENDARMGLLLGKAMLPRNFVATERAKQGPGAVIVSPGSQATMPIGQYQQAQQRLARAFATPEDPEYGRYGVQS